jgi:hypothetical protein
MKRFLFPFCFLSLLFAACGNDAKVKSVQKDEDGTETTTTVDLQKMAEASDHSEKKIEELKKLTPLSLEQLKTLLPEELNDIKRTSYNASSTMGYAMVEGTYQKDDHTELKLVVYDCAGEAGSGFYALTYWGAMNFQQENDNEYTKTVDFKGGKAIENYRKADHHSSLTYLSNDRILVILTSENMDPGALKTAASNLAFKL